VSKNNNNTKLGNNIVVVVVPENNIVVKNRSMKAGSNMVADGNNTVMVAGNNIVMVAGNNIVVVLVLVLVSKRRSNVARAENIGSNMVMNPRSPVAIQRNHVLRNNNALFLYEISTYQMDRQ